MQENGGADGLQLRHKLLLLVRVQMGIGPHDDGNSIADSLGYQNNRVPKFDTERNVAVPKIMDANVWQIG